MEKAFIKKLPGCSLEVQLAIVKQKISNEKDIYTHGSGIETIHTLTNDYMRRHPGPHALYLGTDIRVLGESMQDIRAAFDRLKVLGVTITDLSHPEDDTDLKMYHRAQAGLRWNGNKRQQRYKGSKGGTAKGLAAQAKRDAIMSKEVVIRMCAHPKLTLKDCSDILGSMFSVSTLERHYYGK